MMNGEPETAFHECRKISPSSLFWLCEGDAKYCLNCGLFYILLSFTLVILIVAVSKTLSLKYLHKECDHMRSPLQWAKMGHSRSVHAR